MNRQELIVQKLEILQSIGEQVEQHMKATIERQKNGEDNFAEDVGNLIRLQQTCITAQKELIDILLGVSPCQHTVQ